MPASQRERRLTGLARVGEEALATLHAARDRAQHLLGNAGHAVGAAFFDAQVVLASHDAEEAFFALRVKSV